MPRIILLILLLLVVFYLVSRFQRLDAAKQKNVFRLVLLAGFFGLLFILVITGRFSWLIALIGGLLPLIPRAFRLFMGVWPSVRPYFQRYQQNRQSSMRTRFVSLQIDMLSGALQGEILEGEFAGQALQAMSLEQLLLFLSYCQQHDVQSAALLVAYLDREHAGWRSESEKTADQQVPDSEFDAVVSQRQAREVLGVEEGASKKDIISAHKRLMQKMHPDRGGSDYLAGQINKARDILLKDINR